MPYGFIYKIVFPNGKHYIGQTKRLLKHRQKEHRYDAKKGDTRYLYNALRKYDMEDTLELVEIDTADNQEELDEKEIGYILSYNSFDREYGYNGTLGGAGTNGYVYTEEDNRKNSEAKKKYYEETPGAREKNSEAIRKYYEETPGAREKNSEAQKQYHKDNPEARNQMSEISKKYNKDHPEKGINHSEKMKKYYIDYPEEKEKMSEIKKKYYEDNPEVITQMSEKGKARYDDNPEKRKEHGETIRKYYEENPDAREKCSKAQKKRFENPEEIRKNSERRLKWLKEDPEARRKLGKNKPFDIFKIDGTFVKTFAYQFEAREYLQKEHNITSLIKVGEVLNGNRKSSAGLVFKYQE